VGDGGVGRDGEAGGAAPPRSQALAWVHGVTATHYHNWGVWLARNSAWMRNMLHAMLHDPRCSDLTTTEVKGNPEQDCFTRFVHVAPAGVRLVYMFEELQRSLNSLPLNKVNPTTQRSRTHHARSPSRTSTPKTHAHVNRTSQT